MKKDIFIWGTGCRACSINEIYWNELKNENILGYIDNDPEKTGTRFAGHLIFSPKILDEYKDCYIYIAVSKREAIYMQICEQYPSHKRRILEDGYFRKQKLITRYQGSTEDEIREILDYLYCNPLDIFNYSFVEKYKADKMVVESEGGLLYTIHNGKKMFFSEDYDTEEKVRTYYKGLLIEQDMKSPHRYLTDEFNVMSGAVIVDAGVAEGNFTLDVVDQIKRAYLFEPDRKWMEALDRTFSPYGEKVKIINMGVSDYCGRGTTTIDIAVDEDTIDFIKMDIEGEEYYALNGAKKLINRSGNVRTAVCTYHQEFAYEAIKNKLQEYGFRVSHSYGYMWYSEHFNAMRPAVLRRGLIRAEKGNCS